MSTPSPGWNHGNWATPQPPSPSQGSADAARKAKLENINLRVGILSTVVTLALAVAAFLGIKLNSTNDTLVQTQDTVQTQGSALTQNSAELEQANSAIASLEAENQSLSSQLANPARGVAPTSPTTTAVPAGTVRHQGEVTIAEGGGSIDLNAPASDPKWGLGDNNDPTGGYIYNQGGDLFFTDLQWLKLNSGETADYATCEAKTGYSSAQLYPRDLTDVPTYCFQLKTGRYATVRLISLQNFIFTIEITVWES